MNPSKDRTAVYRCDLALLVLVMLVSSISLLVYCLPLIISLVDPMLTAFIIRGPLQSLVPHVICNSCWEGCGCQSANKLMQTGLGLHYMN